MPLEIVYVDDEPDLLEIFVEDFASDEVRVLTFSDARTAIAHIRKSPPDLLFLDFHIHDMTGEQIAGQLDSTIPKYLVTGNLGMSSQGLFRGILHKPIRTEEIRGIIAAAQSAKGS